METKKNTSWWPTSINGWVIVIGIVLYIALDVIHRKYFYFDPFDTSPRIALNGWLVRVIRDLAFTAVAATLIISGILGIRKNGYTLMRLIAPVSGVLICLVVLIVCIIGYQHSGKLVHQRTSDEVREQIEAKINSPGIPIHIKSRISKGYAGILFHEDGNQVNYITESGVIELYEPTEEEIKGRERLLKMGSVTNWLVRSFYWAIYYWMAVIGISLLAGFMIPVTGNPVSAGSA